MAMVTIGHGKQQEAESREWHDAMDAYRAAFPLRAEWSRSRWLDESEEYGLQRLTVFRGWRDLHDPKSPGYAENRRYLSYRASATTF